MELDGITRVFVLADEGFSQVTRQVFPEHSDALGRDEHRDLMARADLMLTTGGIVWGDMPTTTVIENRAGSYDSDYDGLCKSAERLLGKTGLTIVQDRLGPEDMAYASE